MARRPLIPASPPTPVRTGRRKRLTPDGVFRMLCNRFGDPKDAITQNFAGNQAATVPFWLLGGRSALLGGSNLDAGIGRNIDAECGYENNPSFEYYRAMYDRVGPANRAVNILPDECWGAYPDLYETSKKVTTGFEKAWNDLSLKTAPWHYLHRADRMSGIGSYGVIFLGLEGPENLTAPAASYNRDGTVRKNTQKRRLLYLRAYDQQQAIIKDFETDTGNARYGLPKNYTLRLTPPSDITGMTSTVPPYRDVDVHWTRVLHVADNRESSEVFGVPRLRPVLNTIYDIRKVMGSASEMFWKGGFPGYAFQTEPGVTGTGAVNPDDVAEEVWAYTSGLQRYLTAVGGKWSSLAVQVADPSKHLQMLFTLLCSTLGVPTRIMFGSEAGKLASTQDAETWKDRINGRQRNYLEPMLVRPFVDRMVDLGVLPKPETGNYQIEWRDLRSLGAKDRADVFLKQTQGLMQYVSGQVQTVFPLRQALSMLMGLNDEQTNAVIAAVGENPKPPAPVLPPTPRGGTQNGGPPRSIRRPGRPGVGPAPSANGHRRISRKAA